MPDELIIDVICARLKETDCQTNGWLLDGFPRTKSQADALTAAGMVPDCFVMLDVPEDVLVERVTGRRTDPVTGKIYHMTFKPPETAEIAQRLVQRSDDTAEKIRVRYREFQSHVDAIKSCYADKMVRVDGTVSSADVSKCIRDVLTRAASMKVDGGKNDKDGKNGGGGGAAAGRGAASGQTPAEAATAAGMLSMIALDKTLTGYFRTRGWAFPPALAGMIGVFATLLALQKAAPEAAEAVSDGLSPAVAFIKAWLPLFFVPPLVVLPTKLHLLAGAGAQLSALVVVGAALSLSSAGLLGQALYQLLPAPAGTAAATSVKSAPMPSLPPPVVPATVATAMLLASALAPVGPGPKAALQTAFGTTSTVTGFLLGNTLPAATKKNFHPVLACAVAAVAANWALSAATGVPLGTILAAYFGSGSGRGAGDLISSFLGPAVISFGVQLYQYRAMLLDNATRMVAATAFSAGFGLTSSAVLAKALLRGAPAETALAPLTRCITTPLALAGARLTGADPSLSALIVVITGILGASFGPAFLDAIGVKDPVSVGVAVGAGAHGLGTAALAHDPVKFASSVVSMTLTGLFTVVFMAHGPTLSKLKQLALAP